MPTPPRRRTPAAAPTRRPRVAGLRKPTTPEPAAATEPEQTPEPEATVGQPVDTATPADPTPASGDSPGDQPAGRRRGTGAPVPPEAEAVPGQPVDAAAAARAVPAPAEPTPAGGDSPADRPSSRRGESVLPEAALGQPVDAAAPARAVPAPAEPAPDGDDNNDDSRREQVVTDGVIGAEPAARPTGKRRETGTPLPAAAPEPAPGVKRSGLGTVFVLLGLLTVLFAAAALYFKGQYDSTTSGVDSTNEALVNAALTSEVTGRLTVAVERTLSYSYTDLDANAQAVKETLAGTATCEYDKLFGQVRKLAPEQKLVLTTKVRKIGVTRLAGDRADLLVFVDQSTTRADQGQTTASGAVFGVRAEKLDGAWKITDFDMLDQALPGGQQSTGC
ncbi:Mce-associated membrane protein [Actinokineospora baliensis]|uniref:hypothetical protein n=1 Tax=Actinokineospora baliensis TaxID=547056 RepID=UPI00195E6B01|nr:hypothetical protein [Actinokineospora baliensis]MBM7770365.1 Mce-associated membrane protein [Actinokineospora baliensis]